MLSFSRTGHCVVIKQYPGEREKAENCIDTLMRMYPGSTLTRSWGLFPRNHQINFMTVANAEAVAEWLKQNS